MIHVYDRNPARRSKLEQLKDAGLVSRDTVFRPTLPDRRGEFDFAVVASSNDSHFQLVGMLATMECAVLKEKPLARTLAEASALCGRYGDWVQTLVERPSMPAFRAAAAGLLGLGKVTGYTIRYWNQVPDYWHTWRNSQRLAGGGVILDMGYHMVDIVIRMFGTPMSVTSRVRPNLPTRRRYRVEEDATLELLHESGCRGRIEVSRVAPVKLEQYSIAGTDGTIEFTRSEMTLASRGRLTRRTWASDAVTDAARMLTRAILHYHQEGVNKSDCAHAVNVMRVIHSAYENGGPG